MLMFLGVMVGAGEDDDDGSVGVAMPDVEAELLIRCTRSRQSRSSASVW